MRAGRRTATAESESISSAAGAVDGNAGQLPCRAVLQQARDQRGVHGVAGALGDDVTLDAAAGEGQIADQVEHLVAHVLVLEAERAVFGAFGPRTMAFSGLAPRIKPMSRSVFSSAL